MPATKRLLARADRGAKRFRANNYYSMRRNAFSHSPPESKNHQTTITNAFNTNVDATFPLTDIAAGSGVSGRVGGKIKLKSVKCHLTANGLSGAGTGVGRCRCIMYVPKAISDTLTLPDEYSPVDKDLFWVLSDQYIDTTFSTHTILTHKFPLGMTTEYFAAGADDISKNGVYLYVIATNGSEATGNLGGHTETWYIDN